MRALFSSIRFRYLLAFVAVACACGFASFGFYHAMTAMNDVEDSTEDPQARRQTRRAPNTANTVDAQIETALYARTEFFGAQAFVPYPTKTAREHLIALREKYPNEAQIHVQLVALDEQLNQLDEAMAEMNAYVETSKNKRAALEKLAEFYHARAKFAEEAATIEKLIAIAPIGERAAFVKRLIDTAKIHKLDAYLAPAYYEKIIAANPNIFEVFSDYIEKLTSENNRGRVLDAVRRYKTQFPDRQFYFLEKETMLLVALGREREAERVWVENFDPFWSDKVSENFYEFLKTHDRYRAYGYELNQTLDREPTNFKVAVRLLHFDKNANEDASAIIARLEKTRAARNIKWTPKELATAARLLIANNDGDNASRFLYTLYAQGEMKKGSELRAQILYQLFEVLTDARNERIALTHGDLKLYEEVATADAHPGMLGGVLSLIFSDAKAGREFHREEAVAVKHFNRAAAHRIFTLYKDEQPTSPQLAQMYLDIVRLYTATDEKDVAAKTLEEFATRYKDAPQFAEVALKLADAYLAAGKRREEQELYARILDYLGRQANNSSTPLFTASDALNESRNTRAKRQNIEAPKRSDDEDSTSPPARNSQRKQQSDGAELTGIKPVVADYPPKSNAGINVPTVQGEASTSGSSVYHDYMTLVEERDATASALRRDANKSRVTYGEVLARYVASLDKENRTTDILALYASEIKKHPHEARLYEEMLEWLGQTNLVDEQLRVYREALKQFPTTSWRDRLARWYVRRERKRDFAIFSRQLLAKLDEDDVNDFLNKFAKPKSNDEGNTASNENDETTETDASNFDARLSHALYAQAHARFPHNMNFVKGLLRIYGNRKQWPQWRRLAAEYYFESKEIRDQFLAQLAEHNDLRAQLDTARKRIATNQVASNISALPYKLFRADAAVWLSRYEEAVDAYRELQRLYPNAPEFTERLIAFTRSFGQRDLKSLEEAAQVSLSLADAHPVNATYRTQAGEIDAELGRYTSAREEWEKLITLEPGNPGTYLDTATLYWDYFQYTDALRTINRLRAETNDSTQYAYQAGAILEAQHKTADAIGEYVKALDDNATDYQATRRRLLTLAKRPNFASLINAAFIRERERRSSSSASHQDEDSRDRFVLAYAEFLKDAGQKESASKLLVETVPRSNSTQFLVSAREIFERQKNYDAAQVALRRLITLSTAPRRNILYRLRLAELEANAGRIESAKLTLNQLLQTYPNNYGVLNETASFYWRLGERALALDVLRDGAARGKGRFRYLFARKLAARQIELNQFADAEKTLRALHTEDPTNLDVFRELARVYVRTSNRNAFEDVFRQTLTAISHQDIEPIDVRSQIAEARRVGVKTFTELRDYKSAVAQYIEIINRNPEDEGKLNDALRYVARYPESGGADELLKYYQRTAQEAYQNYRWNVVLARIYEAKNTDANAIENYRAAIAKQPEKRELYEALAKIYVRAENYTSAVESLKKAAALSNDDPRDVRLLIEALEKAGRNAEAAEARKRLPLEADAQKTIKDQFAEAARLRVIEKAKSARAFRAAFNALSSDPFKHELKATEVSGFVESVRDEQNLNAALPPLWALRDRLIAERERAKSADAGKARSMLQTLDNVMPETIGRIASERATGDELSFLYNDLRARLDKFNIANNNQKIVPSDAHNTLPLLQNLAHRSGFGALEEQIIARRKDIALALGNTEVYQTQLRALIQFRTERGDYARVVQLLETERQRDHSRESELLALIAENARLAGDSSKELETLRAYYVTFNNSTQANSSRSTNATSNANNSSLSSLASLSPAAIIARYFEMLYDNGDAGRRELHELTRNANGARYALINFLLAKEERDLAREAIENATRPIVWKRARNAEASYMLRDFDGRNENYFITALRFKNIKEMIARPPDTQRELVGDNWFQLTETYGRWLYLAPDAAQHSKSQRLLPAIIEQRPRDASPQLALGRFYLAHKDAANALKHLTIAAEEQPANDGIIAALGSAYFLRGDETTAEREWNKLIAGENISVERASLYLRTLVENNRAAIARERLAPIVVKYLKAIDNDEEGSGNATREKVSEADLRKLLRSLSHSFENRKRKRDETKNAGEADETNDDTQTVAKVLPPSVEAMRAAYFQRLAEATPEKTFLPELIVRESLVGERERGTFYAMLVARSEKLEPYERDAEFVALQRGSLSNASALEEILDHKNGFRTTESENVRLKWQREYLEYLIQQNETNTARKLIGDIEAELNNRYARPPWLRLARIKIELRENQPTQALLDIKHFVGIEIAPDVLNIAPPNLKRLNETLTALRDIKRDAEIDRLIEVFHARRIALAQYQTTDFVTLARLTFKHGDAKLAAQLLKLMTELGNDATRPATEAALVALPSVKQVQLADTRAELPAALNQINYTEALRFAAETSVEFKRFDDAIGFRHQLVAIAPDDATNRLELARLFAYQDEAARRSHEMTGIEYARRLSHQTKMDEALQMLAGIINDRRQTRVARWQAVELAPEIIKERVDFWETLEQLVNAAKNADREMTSAIHASALAATGRGDEAVKLLREIEMTNPNAYLIYFRTLLQQADHQTNWSQGLIETLAASRDERVVKFSEAFGFRADEPLRQLIRFDAQNNRPLAALRLAENNGLRPTSRTKTVADDENEPDEAPDAHKNIETSPNAERASSTLPTLNERRTRRAEATQRELYGLLANAAEQSGDYALAIAYERAHLLSLNDRVERRASVNYLRRLRARQQTRADLQARLFTIDENLVRNIPTDE